MYDRGTIFIGLGAFLVLTTFPIWYAMGTSSAAERPELQLPKGESSCIESTEYMRGSHMDLLNDWRDEVVRNANRVYTALDGKKHRMSLSGTCLRCHTDQEQFCKKCHDYTGVEPACWDCHVLPEGN